MQPFIFNRKNTFTFYCLLLGNFISDFNTLALMIDSSVLNMK